MESHYNLNDEQFLKQFESAALQPDLFNHEAHLRLAWLHIDRFGLERAIDNVTSQLKNYTKTLGAEDKYNETVTVAALKAVYHFMLKSESKNFRDFIHEFPRLKTAVFHHF